MTLQEFSNTFDVLLNSYNTQAQFGEQASKAEIALDEYEKSVLLTQAQDIIVKSYFDARLNAQGQGFDDSTRRQVDFSSLIKVTELNRACTPATEEETMTVEYSSSTHSTGITMKVASTNINPYTVQVQYMHDNSETIKELDTSTAGTVIFKVACPAYDDLITALNELITTLDPSYHLKVVFTKTSAEVAPPIDAYQTIGSVTVKATPLTDTFDERGILFDLPKKEVGGKDVTDVLFILNEKLKAVVDDVPKEYVIVPISYKEYDREMSKPYAQPLKKQAWRLFQNQATGFDINSELIPKETLHINDPIYRIRYVRRPQPIVLEDLPNYLDIDGVSTATPCELNPILHMDILNKAVELAIATRGGRAVEQPKNNS